MKSLHNRRSFFKLSAAGALGIMAIGPLACSAPVAAVDRKSFGVGLQLYTIRDAMAADVLGSLQKVSNLGYKNIELANYSNGLFYGYAPREFKKIVNDMGMEIISSHTQVEAAGITVDNAQKMADDHADLGVKYCVQPWVEEQDRNVETYKKMVGDWNQVGQIMKGVGIQFAYHNHNFEFANLDGVVPYYDILLAEMDPDLVTMEIDFYWVTKAGQDPVEMFNRFPGRFKLFHMKDMFEQTAPYFETERDDLAPVGEGLIDFKRILAAKDVAGMEYMFVEDDSQGNGFPFEGLEKSINNLTTKILV